MQDNVDNDVVDDEFIMPRDEEAMTFVYLVDHYDLPQELLDRIEAFHTYISNFAAKNGDTTSEEYLLNRQLLLADINAYWQVWAATNPKTRLAQQEEAAFGITSDEDDDEPPGLIESSSDDELPDNSDEMVDTDTDESPRANIEV